MLTLGKKGSLHNRRTAIAYLHQVDMVKRLFEVVAPRSATRVGGYTRIVKLGPRLSDSALMAFIEWVDQAPAEGDTTAAPAAEATPKPEKPARDPNKPKKDRGNLSKKTRVDKAKRAAKRLKEAKAVITRSTRLKSATERSKAAAKKRTQIQ